MLELATNETAASRATLAGQRVKAYDTGDVFSDPIRAIKEIVKARKEKAQRKGTDVSALEQQIRDLTDELSRRNRALDDYIKTAETKAKRTYGARNTRVTQTEYDAIIARRKKVTFKDFITSEQGTAPSAQDLSDLAKIGMYHIEALGRDFQKWAYLVQKDLGARVGR